MVLKWPASSVLAITSCGQSCFTRSRSRAMLTKGTSADNRIECVERRPLCERNRSAHAGHVKAWFAAGTIDTKRLDEAAFLLGHEDGLAVGAAKGEVGRLLPGHRHLALQRSIGADDGDLAGRQPREIDPAVDVGAQAVDLKVRKRPHQPRIEQLVAVEAIGP